MKALVLKAYKQMEITDLPEPPIGPREVLIRVRACGICGSDVHGFDGSTGRRIPPIVMGHEAAGVVAQVGSEVDRFKAGDRVTFDSTIYCGNCFFCRRGDLNLCDRRRVLGVSCGDYRQHGAFAEYVAVPEHIVYSLPERFSLEHACLIEPVSIAFHAVDRSRIALGATAVVIGAGMIGLAVIQALRLAGCGRIFAADLDERRLELARQLGADETCNPQNGDLATAVKQATDGRGADVAVEAVGATAPVNLAVNCLRKGGTLTLIGNVAPKIEFPLQLAVTRELTVLGSCASRGDYPACISMMSRGLVQVAPLISASAPLAEGPQWFDRLYRQEPGLMKVLLKP
jgi:L-iditol 2-dehydrogenase